MDTRSSRDRPVAHTHPLGGSALRRRRGHGIRLLRGALLVGTLIACLPLPLARGQAPDEPWIRAWSEQVDALFALAGESTDPARPERIERWVQLVARGGSEADPSGWEDQVQHGFAVLLGTGDAGIADLLAGHGADALAKRGRVEKAIVLLEALARPRTESLAEATGRLGLSRLGPVRLYLAQLLRGDARWSDGLAELDRLDREVGSSDLDATDRAVLWAGIAAERGRTAIELGWVDRALENAGRLRARAAELDSIGATPALLADALSMEMDARALLEQFDAIVRDLADDSSWSTQAHPTRAALLRLQRATALAQLTRRGQDRYDPALLALDRSAVDPALAIDSRVHAWRTAAEMALDLNRPQDAADRLGRARKELDSSGATLSRPAEAEFTAVELRAKLAGSADAEELAGRVRDLGSKFDRFLGDWSAVERPEGGLSFLQQASRRAILATLVAGHLAVDGAEAGSLAALDVVLRAQACGSLARSLGAEVPDLDRIRRTLLVADDHGIVIHVPGADTLHVFAIDREGLIVEQRAGYRAIRERVRTFVDQLTQATTDAGDGGTSAGRAAWLLETSAELTADLLPPRVAERVKSWGAVTFVGLDLVSGLPGEALSFDGRELLGEVRAVDLWPSIPTAGVLLDRPAAANAGQGVLLCWCGEPGVGDRLGLAPFELGPEDLDPIRRAYAPGDVRVLGGDEFTPAALGAADLPGYAVAHLFAHGVYDDRRVRGATLALAGDEDGGLFGCREVEGLGAPDLVFLAACSAALGPRRVGDDTLSHLGGAFLASGARTVVLSRAKVELNASLECAGIFHRSLGAGASPAEAMRTAREALVKEAPEGNVERWRLARMQVLGLGHVPVFPR